MNVVALVDCNSFYASCETIFKPHLKNQPVVVLSNNDGCVIARSSLAKKVGIKMGVPFFEVKELVKHQAKLANKAKLDALVCSAHEIKFVKKYFKKEIITPGISFKKIKNDQKRITTPYEAYYKYKSDWLVIGRSITKGNIKKNLENLIFQIKKE